MFYHVLCWKMNKMGQNTWKKKKQRLVLLQAALCFCLFSVTTNDSRFSQCPNERWLRRRLFLLKPRLNSLKFQGFRQRVTLKACSQEKNFHGSWLTCEGPVTSAAQYHGYFAQSRPGRPLLGNIWKQMWWFEDVWIFFLKPIKSSIRSSYHQSLGKFAAVVTSDGCKSWEESGDTNQGENKGISVGTSYTSIEQYDFIGFIWIYIILASFQIQIFDWTASLVAKPVKHGPNKVEHKDATYYSLDQK